MLLRCSQTSAFNGCFVHSEVQAVSSSDTADGEPANRVSFLDHFGTRQPRYLPVELCLRVWPDFACFSACSRLNNRQKTCPRFSPFLWPQSPFSLCCED